jgi:hypothetical protein
MPSHPYIVPRPAGYEELIIQANTLLFFGVSYKSFGMEGICFLHNSWCVLQAER